MQASFYIEREYQEKVSYKEMPTIHSYLNFHSPLEIWLVLKGSYECWVNEKRMRLKQGEMVVSFSYDAHNYRILEEGSEMGVLVVPIAACGEFQGELRQKRASDPVIRDGTVFERVHRALTEMSGAENEMEKRGHLYVALGMILSHLSLEERQEKQEWGLSTRLLCYLQENFKGRLSLTSTATALGYHPGYLSQYFKENFHVSFGRYVIMLRLRESVLLMQEGKSLAECAFESGFGSLRTFHRVFREEFQCTPKQYMTELKK